MQPVLSSHGQRCPGVVSFSLSRVLLKETVHCTPLLSHCRGELASWDASVCWLLEHVCRHICLSASLPWILLLSLLATIGTAYPGIRFFHTLCRIVWTYQHLLSILYLSVSFPLSCMRQLLSPAIWEEHCELHGVGLSFIRTGKTVCLPSPSMYWVWRWTFLGFPTHVSLVCISLRFLEGSVIRFPFFPDGSLVKRGFRLPEHG